MTEPSPQPGERLNKYLALHLGISRREADTYIEENRVAINGTLAVLGARVLPGDSVEVDHKSVEKAPYVYIAFYKPTGYVSSRRAQGDAPTLYELLPNTYHSLKPVGRLDKDSSGLLLLTNDGDFAFKMTHPKFYKTKQYDIVLSEDLEPLHQQMISDYGVKLDDGPSKLHLERQTDRNRKEWKVVMTEGRNRQIRRTFKALGYTVAGLHRTNFGSYSLGDMKPGEYKQLKIS